MNVPQKCFFYMFSFYLEFHMISNGICAKRSRIVLGSTLNSHLFKYLFISTVTTVL
jgi:hypothetical protein